MLQLILYHYFNSSFELSVDIFDYLDTLVELEKRSEFSLITIEVSFLLRKPLLCLSMIKLSDFLRIQSEL